MDVFRLDGDVALVTGGGTGLGYAIAKCLAEAGAHVVITGRRSSVLKDAADVIGANASAEVFDVTHTDEAPKFAEMVAGRVGPISILVNNAGNHLKKDVLEMTEDEFLSVFHTHITGALALSKAVAPAMIERESGSILFTASMNSYIGMPKVVAYSTAKAAMLGLVQSLTADLSPHGIRVNAIAPGWIDTPMLHKAIDTDPERKARILNRIPLGRFGQPEDIGRAAVYLSSKAAQYVTGTVLPIDGGALHGF
jgi:gluconate 5-dehydrogenase